MAEIGPKDAFAFLCQTFTKWGLPKRIKVDNGLPFVNPHQRDIPTLLVLWLIALGMEVKQNDPGRPQQNGTVEGLQGVCNRWASSKEHETIESFQQALDEAVRVQVEVYRMPAKKHLTRLQVYPELKTNPRKFDPTDIQWQRVKVYLAAQVWTRSVCVHAISFFNQKIYLGKQYAKQEVTLTYDPLDELIIVRTKDGTLIRTVDKQIVTIEQILQFAGMSKN